MELRERLERGDSVAGVVGLGYVGLPLAVEIAAVGDRVIGFDVSQQKVAAVSAGASYIPDVTNDVLAPLVKQGTLSATTDFGQVALCDAVAICVPTPLDDMREPDVSYMVEATKAMVPYLHPGMLVTLESTTYPGTTEEILLPILESSGLKVGENIHLAYSPERVDPGNATYHTKNTPKVVGGVTQACTECAQAFYGRFLDTVVPVSSTRTAEMSKLLENIFRCVNIALVNELLMLSERMGVDIWEVVEAAKTKPFGFMPFYPGPGLGGHCIPIDPFYLSWKAREYDFHTEFIELAGNVNENMPYYVVQRVMDCLNGQCKALSTSRVLMLGVAYKADSDDVRESPSIRIAELLSAKGARVVYHDPFVDSFSVKNAQVPRVELTPDELAASDLALVVTAHNSVDYDMVAKYSPLVFDTRHVFNGNGNGKVMHL